MQASSLRMSTWSCTCLLKVTGRHSKRCLKRQQATPEEQEHFEANQVYKAVWKREMHLRTQLWLLQQQQQLLLRELFQIQQERMLRSMFLYGHPPVHSFYGACV